MAPPFPPRRAHGRSIGAVARAAASARAGAVAAACLCPGPPTWADPGAAAPPPAGPSAPAGTSLPTDVSLPVGGVRQLPLAGAAGGGGRWESSDPETVAVYGDGFAVALRPGRAVVSVKNTDGSTARFAVEVARPTRPVVAAADLRQFDDSRKFEVAGRLCYGSELNGRRATDPADRQNLRSNRVINPTPLTPGKPLHWELRPGTAVLDGAGVRMGIVPPTIQAGGRTVPAAKFNYGMSKVLGGRLHLYAFAVELVPVGRGKPARGGAAPADAAPAVTARADAARAAAAPAKADAVDADPVGTSAWVALDDVVDPSALLPRLGLGQPALPRMALVDARHAVTGGDPARYVGQGGELGIVRAVNGPVPSHYLRRPSGTVNVLYSVPGFGLGGQSLDSLLVRDGLTFRRAVGAKAFVQPTYYPKGHPQAGQVAGPTMTFWYGAVEAEGMEPVFGWVAREALRE